MSNSLRLRSKLALALLVFGALLTGSVPLQNPRVRSLGEMLTCQCGCNYSVASCNMQGCGFADPARARLMKMVESGMSDEAILAAFEREYGKVILRQPPTQGFYLVSWIMPFAGLGAGLVLLWLILRHYLARRPSTVGATASADVPSPELERYRERIEKDLADLDRDSK